MPAAGRWIGMTNAPPPPPGPGMGVPLPPPPAPPYGAPAPPPSHVAPPGYGSPVGAAAPGGAPTVIHPPGHRTNIVPPPGPPLAPFGQPSPGQPAYAAKSQVRRTPDALGFRSVDTIGTIVSALFMVWIPLSVYFAVLNMRERNLIHKYGLDPPFAEWNSLQNRIEMVTGLSGGLLLITGPLFLMWFARAYGNLPTISPGPTKSGTTGATLSWILPFVNLIRPFVFLREIWIRTESVDAIAPKPHSVIVAYWTSWIGSVVVQSLLGVVLVKGAIDSVFKGDLTYFRIAANLYVLSSVITVVAGALAGVVVWQITQRMTKRCQEITLAVVRATER